MTRPLRIVARVHSMPPDHNAGSEWMLHSMLRPLVQRGHDVQVWLSRYGASREPYTLDGVQVVPQSARLDLPTAIRRADLVISHLENVPSAGAMARGYGKPLVVIGHNCAGVIFRNMALAGTALAVYNSHAMRREADVVFGERPEWPRPQREIVVRPPVFAADYATTPGDRVTLVNLCKEKGGEVFWRLARRLPDVKFLAVKGAYGQQITYDDLPNVDIVDHTPGDRMRDEVYARTRVLLMPSTSESWGRAAVEAMHSGIPVICSPLPGTVEMAGEAGIFAEPRDTGAWVAAVKRLLEPGEWRLASKRALARARELDPAKDLAAWCDAVEELGGSRGRVR